MTDKEYDNITLIAAATLASPPRPDASAGLIEAAEWLEANRTKFGVSRSPVVMSCAKELRSRAAYRSRK